MFTIIDIFYVCLFYYHFNIRATKKFKSKIESNEECRIAWHIFFLIYNSEIHIKISNVEEQRIFKKTSIRHCLVNIGCKWVRI